jgi:hypothetical protein
MSAHRNNRPSNSKRRAILKLGAGTGIVAAGAALPRRWTRPLIESAVLPAHAQATMLAGPFFNSSPILLLVDAGGSIMDQIFPKAYASGTLTFQLCISVSGITASIDAYVADGVALQQWFSGTADAPSPSSLSIGSPTPLTNACGGPATASILISAVGATVDGTFYFNPGAGQVSNNFSIGAGVCSLPPVTCPR